MSASTPSAIPQDRRRRSDRVFWGLSVAFHGVLAAVLLAIPAREYLFRKETIRERARVNTRGDELERIVEEIRDRTADRIRARVALLKSGQERMATNFDTMNKYYQPFVSEQRQAAAARFDTYAGKALQAMDELRLMLDHADETKDTAKVVAVKETVIPRITSWQEEVRRSMMLLELADADLQKKQEEAEDGQHKVTSFMRWANGCVHSIARRRKELPELKARVANMKLEMAAKIKERDAAAAARDAAKKELDAARAAERKEKDRKKRNELRKTVKRIEGQVRGYDKKRNDAERRISQLKREIERDQKKVDEHEAKLPEEIKKRDELLHVAKNIQTGSYYKQKDIIETIRKRIEQTARETEKQNGTF